MTACSSSSAASRRRRAGAAAAARGDTARAVPLAYVVHDGDAGSRLAWRASELLRDAGFGVVVNAGGGSFKSQMKRADASGARYALLIGADEAAADAVS